jgi:3-oxoacyl-[acyl-carrier-protein] synthase II
MIEYGDADIMITGGSDSIITEFSVAGFGLLGALSKNNDNPGRASRPFDLRRDGFILGEGAGILIMEELEQDSDPRPMLTELPIHPLMAEEQTNL